MRTGLPQPFGRSADVLFGGVQRMGVAAVRSVGLCWGHCCNPMFGAVAYSSRPIAASQWLEVSGKAGSKTGPHFMDQAFR